MSSIHSFVYKLILDKLLWKSRVMMVDIRGQLKLHWFQLVNEHQFIILTYTKFKIATTQKYWEGLGIN